MNPEPETNPLPLPNLTAIAVEEYAYRVGLNVSTITRSIVEDEAATIVHPSEY